jgi:hypothetical protein
VEIRIGDATDSAESLARLLTGIDTMISAIDAGSQLAQIALADAAKLAGIKRFVPCAFITVCPPGGVMELRDQVCETIKIYVPWAAQKDSWYLGSLLQKEQVYQHIRKIYLPYTIIDVGYWYQLSFPSLPSGRVDYAFLGPRSFAIEGDGDAKTAITDLRDIGRFVANIITDERTLNKSVLCYGAVVSQKEAFRLLEEA